MGLIKIGRLNDNGAAAAREMLVRLSEVADPRDRRDAAMEIILNPDLVEEVSAAGMIDLDAVFDNAFDFAAHVYPALIPVGETVFLDKGVNLFLLLAHVTQHVSFKAKVIDYYFIEERGNGGVGPKRNYRNPIYVHLFLYHFHHAVPSLCRPLLASAVHEISMAEDRVAQRPAIMGSRGAIGLLIALFFNPATGKRHRTPAAPKNSKVKNKNVNDALKELSVIVFGQCAENYDLARMTARQMYDLVPDTRGLKPYKKYAIRFFETQAAEASEGEAGAGVEISQAA